jgi:hypothetical protein
MDAHVNALFRGGITNYDKCVDADSEGCVQHGPARADALQAHSSVVDHMRAAIVSAGVWAATSSCGRLVPRAIIPLAAQRNGQSR